MFTAPASAAARPSPPMLDWRRLADAATWTAVVLFGLLALLLAVRRLSGAVAQPIAGPILVPLAAGLAAASVLLRFWLLPLRLPSLARNDIRDWLVLVVPSIAVALLLAAIVIPGTSWLAALAALLFAGTIEGLFWRHVAVALRPREISTTPGLPRAGSAPETDGDEVVAEESYPPNLLQQIIRTREGSGEAIHAVLRAEFQVGEQVQVLHVAFCPPLEMPPRIEAYATGETAADVKITGAFTFGARLEVQLSQPTAAPTSVLVELTSSS